MNLPLVLLWKWAQNASWNTAVPNISP